MAAKPNFVVIYTLPSPNEWLRYQSAWTFYDAYLRQTVVADRLYYVVSIAFGMTVHLMWLFFRKSILLRCRCELIWFGCKLILIF